MKFEMIPSDQIRPAPWQPREEFKKDTIEKLSNSLGAVGLIQPIIVRKKGKTYQITAGERRWRAWKVEFGSMPCIVREEDDTDAKITSVVENWQREAVGEQQNEEFIAKLYQEGFKKEKWKSYAGMQRATGIGETTIRDIVVGREEKEELKIRPGTDLSYTDMRETRTLKDEPQIRKKILEKRSRGELKRDELRGYSDTLKKAPEPVKKAIIEEKIDYEDAKPLIEHGIPEDLKRATVEELSKRKKERDRVRHEIEEMSKMETEEDLAVIKGDLKAKGLRVEPSPDEIRFRKFESVAITVTNWRPFHLKKIKNEKYREMAIESIKEARDALDALLSVLEKGG